MPVRVIRRNLGYTQNQSARMSSESPGEGGDKVLETFFAEKHYYEELRKISQSEIYARAR